MLDLGRGRANANPPLPQIMTSTLPLGGDGKPAILQRAIEAAGLGHEPSWSPVDPVQVSMVSCRGGSLSYTSLAPLLHLI